MSLSRNATYNAIGNVMLTVLAVVTVPLYLHIVGIERYGLLALCWVFLSYSSFMDFGLGPAVAREIARSRDGEENLAAEALWTAIWLSLAISLVAAAAVYAIGTFYFGKMAKVAPAFRSEVAAAVPLMAAMVPGVMLSGVLASALQGRERFLAFNVATVLGNVLLGVLPLIVAYFWSPAVPVLLAASLAARLVPLPWLFQVCSRAVPLNGVRRPSAAAARRLLGFGGWISLTAMAGVVLGTAARLAVGGTLGAAAVSIYTIAFNLVSRVAIVANSVGAALFPRFAYLEKGDRDELVLHGLQTIAAIVTPLLIGAVMLVDPFFAVWIGPELTEAALPVAYLVVIGFWFYCIGSPAQSLLQASGRPDLVSKVMVAEVLPFVGATLLALSLFGLPGGALVFTLRSVCETVAFLLLARIPWPALRSLLLPAGLTLAAAVAAGFMEGLGEYLILLVLLAAATMWSAVHAPRAVLDRLARLGRFVPGGRVG